MGDAFGARLLCAPSWHTVLGVPLRGDDYDARFTRFAAEGHYLHGEADLVAELVGAPPPLIARRLRTGRIADRARPTGLPGRRHRRRAGHAQHGPAKAPTLEWVLGDLFRTELPEDHFDVAVAAGNVMIFVELGTEAAVVSNLSRSVVPGGLVVTGFQVGRQLTLDRYDALGASAGLDLVHRWATWERSPYTGGDYAVSVHRRSTAP